MVRRLRLTFISVFALVAGVLSGASAAPAATASAPVLARDGRTAYVIALAHDAIPAERTAARELATYLHQVTGAHFPVRVETAVPRDAPQILVGAGARARQLLPFHDWSSFGAEGVVLKTVGRTLVLAGGRPRGTLYAVGQFLEEQVGVRWWAPGESTVPRRATLRLPRLDVAYRPPFDYRAHSGAPFLHDPLFATRLQQNAAGQGEALGGVVAMPGAHTFFDLLPPSKYFAAHPEWYSDAANGDKPSTSASRLPDARSSQLCLADEAARRELTRVVLARLRADTSLRIVSVSQNDTRRRCRGEGDMALEALEGSPSGPLLHFVNAVAVEVERAFPEVVVETLAYQYTRKPPRQVRPRANVLVRLCSFEADFGQPLTAESNRDFLDDLDGWRAIAPRLYVWDYVTNFMHGIWPHPNLGVLGPNLRLFAARGVRGVYEQGDSFTNSVGDFVQMRAWVLAHLLWNPAQDERRLIAEFLRGYYGAAAPHLQAYLDLMQAAFRRSGKHLSLYQEDHAWLTLAVMNEATRHFRAAEAAVAGHAAFSARVRRERLALDHVWLVRYGIYQRQAQGGAMPFGGPADPVAAALEFVRTARRYGVANHSEVEQFSAYFPRLLLRNRPPAPLPAGIVAERAGRPVEVIDAQEHAFEIFSLGGRVGIVDDAQASDGLALRISGLDNPWAMRYVPEEDADYLAAGAWRYAIVARVQAVPGAPADALEAPAINYGLFDPAGRRYAVRASQTLAQMAGGEYQVLDLGVQTVSPQTYFYFSLAGNPWVEAIYIDRVVMVRAER